jgi:hypothetical protein
VRYLFAEGRLRYPFAEGRVRFLFAEGCVLAYIHVLNRVERSEA